MSKYKFCIIRILKSTRDKIKFDGQSYDDVILRLISHKCDSHKSDIPYIDFIDEMIKENKK